MSKILRRPMFRGGPVDSRGTGITSGLMDTPTYATGGRVGYNQGAFVVQPPGAQGKSIFEIQDILKSVGAPMTGQQILDFASANQMNLGRDFKINPKSKFIPDEVVENEGTENEITIPFSEKIQKEGFQTYEDPNEKYLGSGDTQGSQDEITDLTTEQVTDALKSTDNNDTTGNNTSNVEISAEDLIRENAELFKELLGEASKEDIKKARIGDASDYLLKFFEGTQKEGATVGSAAADVAGFATSRDSRTEKARAANEKVDQTATVLAINDYISGKRSKEQIQEALSLAAAKVSLSAGTLGDKILKAKGSGPVTVTVIRDVLRSEPEFKNKTIEEFDSTKADLTYSAGDENKIFIDAITKNTFTFDANKNKIKIY